MAISTKSDQDTERRPSGRLSRADRRSQLLRTATALIEELGADALTLGALAERAGVSKPIAYDHFESRTGLLLALLAETDSHYEGVAREQLAAAPQTLDATAAIVATAYVACALEAGPAASALVAAIEANGDAKEVWLTSRDIHVAQFAEAFAPVLENPSDSLRLTFIGLVAAANALCTELTAKRISKSDAETTLTHLLISALTAYTR
ncbi:MAG: TetR/AcrR family transcriptional regulator [Rhodobiaceae bacterium]|nr:TetR/AcrR family transcriptional regulator [Rhodobiaceae bacterium]